VKRLLFILAFFPLLGFAQVDSFRIVFKYDFETNDIGAYTYNDVISDWYPSTNNEINKTYIEQCTDADNLSKIMRCDYDEGDWGLSESGIQWWTYLGDEYNELYMSYRLRLKEGFDPVLSGKFSGLYAFPDFPSAPIDVDKGFSCKFTWTKGCNPPADSAIYVYYYDHLSAGPYGDAVCFNYDLDSFKTEWRTVTLRLVMNTFVGSTPQQDGILEVFMDSICVYTGDNFQWVEDQNIGINRMHIENFFGGGDEQFAAKRDEWVKFDDFVVWSYGSDVTGLPKGNNSNQVGDTIIIPPQSESEYEYGTRYEFNDDSPNYYADTITNTTYVGQQFTVGTVSTNENHDVDSIYWFGRTTAESGTLTFYIDSLDGDSYPDGDHIYSGTIDIADITSDAGGDGYYVAMTGSDSLITDGHYGIYSVSSSSLNTMWFSDNAGTYTGGYELIYDGSWAEWSAYDVVFAIYGTPKAAEEEEQITSDTVSCDADTMVYYIPTTNDYWSAMNLKKEGQVFVPQQNFDISCIQILASRSGALDTLEIMIYAVEDSIPTGDSLSYAVRNYEWITTDDNNADTLNIEMSEYTFTALDTFAIVFKCKNANEDGWINNARIRSYDEGAYTSGYRITTTDGGVTWTKDKDTDFWFVVYGDLSTQNSISFKKNGSTVQFKKNANDIGFSKN